MFLCDPNSFLFLVRHPLHAALLFISFFSSFLPILFFHLYNYCVSLIYDFVLGQYFPWCAFLSLPFFSFLVVSTPFLAPQLLSFDLSLPLSPQLFLPSHLSLSLSFQFLTSSQFRSSSLPPTDFFHLGSVFSLSSLSLWHIAFHTLCNSSPCLIHPLHVSNITGSLPLLLLLPPVSSTRLHSTIEECIEIIHETALEINEKLQTQRKVTLILNITTNVLSIPSSLLLSRYHHVLSFD